MKKTHVAWLIAAGLAVGAVAQAGGLWTEDYDKALTDAKQANKYVLLDFTGSDWCGWCMKLDKQVFDKKDFKEFAEKNLVCVKLDFPRGKPQSKKVKEQNRALQNKYKVQGYPTVLLLTPAGDVAAQTGYKEGGAKAYVEHLQGFMKEQPAAGKADPKKPGKP